MSGNSGADPRFPTEVRQNVVVAFWMIASAIYSPQPARLCNTGIRLPTIAGFLTHEVTSILIGMIALTRFIVRRSEKTTD